MISPTLFKIFIGICWGIFIIFPIIFFPSYIRYSNNYSTVKYDNDDYDAKCTQIKNDVISLNNNYSSPNICNGTFVNCILYNATNHTYYYCNDDSICAIVYLCADFIYENYTLIDNDMCIHINYPYNYFATICIENGTMNTYVNDTNLHNQQCITTTYHLLDINVTKAPQLNFFEYNCQIAVYKHDQLYETYTYHHHSNNIVYTIDSENIELCCCRSNCPSVYITLNQSCIFGSCVNNEMYNAPLFAQNGISLAIIAEIVIFIIGCILVYKFTYRPTVAHF